MKKLFMEPAITVDMFASEDVIAASFEDENVWHDDMGSSSDGYDNGGKDIF